MEGFGGKASFNMSALAGLTNGTKGAVMALEQVTLMAAQLKAGATAIGERAKEECRQVTAAAQAAVDQVQALELTMVEVRSTTAATELIKNQMAQQGATALGKLAAMQAPQPPTQAGQGEGGQS
jgi:hypothetical protein